MYPKINKERKDTQNSCIFAASNVLNEKEMKKLMICAALATALLAGCSGDEKAAQARLDKAREMYERNELFGAKNEIDSLRALYPKEVKVLKQGLRLMREVEMKEAERNIAYCDSLLPIKLEEVEGLKKGFVFEKDSAYEEIGNYIWKRQTIERNVQRCYIRCGVSEEGEMYLASVYYGGRPIEHTGIRLSLKDGQFAETASIPYDGGINYRFKDMGSTTEVVTYKGEHGIDAVKFIYDNADERIKVEYTGGKPYVIYMADADKKAVVSTFNLATVLSDIQNMTTLKEKSEKKIAYLKSKIEKPEP